MTTTDLAMTPAGSRPLPEREQQATRLANEVTQ